MDGSRFLCAKVAILARFENVTGVLRQNWVRLARGTSLLVRQAKDDGNWYEAPESPRLPMSTLPASRDEILGGTEDGEKEERNQWRGPVAWETGRCGTTPRGERSGDAGHQLREPG